jgi:hypothetical protein
VALPTNALRKARSYALKQWERLESYAGAVHGMVENDNHWPENSVRPITQGSRNWIQTGNERAMRAVVEGWLAIDELTPAGCKRAREVAGAALA